jgi:hypothetical protein
VLQKRLEEAIDTVPCDLDTDAEQYKSDNTKNPVRGCGRDRAGDLRGVSVAEIYAPTERNGGDKQTDVGEDGFCYGGVFGVDAERKHDDDAARASSDGKGEGIEGLFLEAVDFCPGDGGSSSICSVGLFLAWVAIFLVQERPTNHGEDDATGDLHDRQRDAEEAEKSRANKFDNSEEDDGIDGNSAGERTVGVGRSVSNEAEEDQRGPERVDDGKKRAKAQSEKFPEKIHGSQSKAYEIAAILEVIVRCEGWLGVCVVTRPMMRRLGWRGGE